MSNLFDSIFNNATATVDPLRLLLALLVSLFLGMGLSWTYKYRTLYTREFVISLTLLPCMMTLVIFLVNGSLGTSFAVADSFPVSYEWFERVDCDFSSHDYRTSSRLRLSFIGHFINPLFTRGLACLGEQTE